MRVTIDLMKKSTQIIDLSNVINPRVGDDDLQLPLHIGYGDNLFDMRGKDVEFISNDPNKKNIYIAGTCNTNTPGDNLYMGDLTFRFPAGTFQADGTYDLDKTMFRIVDKETQKVISSVNIKITVMKNSLEFDFDPDKSSYDSRLENMLHDFHDKGQAMLDEIKDLNNQAKSNVSGDTATTANEAKKQADQNAGDISDLKGEVAGARGRFANVASREDAQDAAINQKESIVNANANYAALQQKNAQQDSVLAQKAGKFEIESKLAQMDLQPEAFENEAALKAKYPNGKPGLMVTADTGHKWLWIDGDWKNCGVYQSAGIADHSITADKLSSSILTGEDLLAGVNLLTSLNTTVDGYGYSADAKNSYQATVQEGQTHYKISQHTGSTAYATWAFQTPTVYINGDLALRLKCKATLDLTVEYVLTKSDGTKDSKTLDLKNDVSGTEKTLTVKIPTSNYTGFELNSIRGTLGATAGDAEFYDISLFPAEDLDKPYSNLLDAITKLTALLPPNSNSPIRSINTVQTGYAFSNDSGNNGHAEKINDMYHYMISQRDGSTAYTTWSFGVTVDLNTPKVISFKYRGTLKFTIEYQLIKNDGTMVAKTLDGNNDTDGQEHQFSFIINDPKYTKIIFSSVRGTFGAAAGDLEMFDFDIADERDIRKNAAVAKMIQAQQTSYIMLNFDDATNMYKDRYELLKSYGFRFSFCLNEGFYNNKGFVGNEREQFNQMVADGNDVALYGGVGTRPDIQTCTPSQWADYVKPLVDLANQNGIYNITCYHSPNNAMTANGAQGLKQLGFKMARYATDPSKSLIDDFTQDSFLVPTLEIQDDNLNDVTAKIDEAIDEGASLSIFTHLVQTSATNEWNTSLSVYKQMLDYIKQKVDSDQIKVVTWREFYAAKLPHEGHENDYQRIVKMLSK